LGWTTEFLNANKPWVVTLPEPIAEKLRQGKPLNIRFEYRDGQNGLDIQSVELLADGKPVAKDAHEGFTGTHPNKPDYLLTLPKNTAGSLTLRIKANGSGGNDSRGEIILKP
jgi:hypothetical protein